MIHLWRSIYQKCKVSHSNQNLLCSLFMTADYVHEGYRTEEMCRLWEIFLKASNRYLNTEIEGSRKTTENSDRLGRRTRLCPMPASKAVPLSLHNFNNNIIQNEFRNRVHCNCVRYQVNPFKGGNSFFHHLILIHICHNESRILKWKFFFKNMNQSFWLF